MESNDARARNEPLEGTVRRMLRAPGWVWHNRLVAWTSYLCILIGFGCLALALVAAGSGYRTWALTAAVICAVAFVTGFSLFGATAHHDRVTHHVGPDLLADRWPNAADPLATAPRVYRPGLRQRLAALPALGSRRHHS